jgi:SAM-dependent methyltransferase
VIDLGPMPAVNNLLEAPDAACPTWPLQVVFCRACTLVQITEAPPPDLLFRDYCYFSSQSETMVEHARGLVDRFVAPGTRVVEIASNDGYLLRHAQEKGAEVLGIDPARNVAAHAEAAGVPTRCDYFDEGLARQLLDEIGPADVLFANNVLAHVPDPNEIVAGIAILLARDGVAHVEVPYVVGMIDQGAFDTIYHEHHCYFSVTALRALVHRHGLRLADVEVVPIHGGSLHLKVAREGDEAAAEAMCSDEAARGVGDDAFYASFESGVRHLEVRLSEEIDRFGTVAGFGCAAKAVVLLNTFRLGPERVAWVADVSPHKQGRWVPGTRQPIVHPRRLVEEAPDACILFPWNIAGEIRRRNAAYTDGGGRFIVPIPEVTIA